MAKISDGFQLRDMAGKTVYMTVDNTTADQKINVSDAPPPPPPPPPAVQIIDDGDPGFSSVGDWKRWSNQGFKGDVMECMKGDGGAVATWTFTVVPGTYKVSATYTPFTNRATNAPFSIYDGATLLQTVAVNQQQAPIDFPDGGANWKVLGTVTITGSELTVKLNNAADGNLNADAIRIEKVG